ncbi:unnamed protein product [Ectocarpus sp. CCAP 1310/34]|nr:unnamed protein product [Ectocarpus sp. CCAP 1310/34]
MPSSPEHNLGLKAHAAEFVPGGAAAAAAAAASGGGRAPPSKASKKGGRSGAEAKAADSSDLTAFAQEFVPGGGGGGTSSGDAAGPAAAAAVATGGTGPEKMVQVVRGGTIYFVPESEALATDELVGPEAYGPQEEGFLWAEGSAALAAPQRRTMHSTAVPEQLWAEFQNHSLSVLRQLPPDDERLKEIPPQFYAAFPLDDASKTRGTAGSFGYPSETYKVIQHHNGQAFALRRFDTARTTAKIVAMGTEIWLSMPEHPAITRPREVGKTETRTACGGLPVAFLHRNALFFVSDFHPGAETLSERFIQRQGGLLSEGLLWRLMCQLLSALRATHAAGAALRNVHPSRVLYCLVGDRVRVNWVGCLDVLEYETRKQARVSELQRQDMVDLGSLILALACRHPVTAASRGESLAFMAQHYTPELHNLAASLVSKKPPSVFEVCVATAHHTMDAMENTLMANGALQSHLASEYDNGRLLRLLLKLGTVNERPDQGGVGEWSETGERYILKLFRDYLFHQVDADGEPVMDFGHVYQSLSLLDAGNEEKILLTSRDKRSLLVVSFADVKRCLEEAFAEEAVMPRTAMAITAACFLAAARAVAVGGEAAATAVAGAGWRWGSGGCTEGARRGVSCTAAGCTGAGFMLSTEGSCRITRAAAAAESWSRWGTTLTTIPSSTIPTIPTITTLAW